MSQLLLSLGAINKITDEYVYPKIANKKDEYICPECSKDLILCQGEIRVHHFRHKVDNINPCHHYSNPTETEIHKDAKILLKNLLERKIPISFIRKCSCCKTDEVFEIPEITDCSIIHIEYRFDFNGLKIADVAYIDNGVILCIFEIYNTHKTCSENRPEPWFEIDAETLIKMANNIDLTLLQIPCIRCEKCDECNEIKITPLTKCSIPCFDDDTSGDYHLMRYMKQQHNINKSISILTYLDDECVKYVKGNHVITITHPVSNVLIRRSTINSKTFIKGKWMFIDLVDIVDWYKSIEGIIILCSECCYLCKTIGNSVICIKCKCIKSIKYHKIVNKFKYSKTPTQKKKWKSLLDLRNSARNIESLIDFKDVLDNDSSYVIGLTHPNTSEKIIYNLKNDCIKLNDNSISVHWKIENIIYWFNGNGIFNRCDKCKCIYSYSNIKFVCKTCI
jgi:hypothetical protein